ncbi:hypothetical protein [Streptomyces sp. NBC_01264]|uniref:hypothetical protein n=1 Tax=Streptomyces sp. NBC_01264 TaxID=2903804 RepID=UPI00224DD0F8|nr:hypothetical protein [Streptomyces sp. NBC_01264]MCX4779173.1 hypothetical protein [Streptomyces sp. NBC_01264]
MAPKKITDTIPQDQLRELVTWLQEEHGPATEGERAAAFDELKVLDAEHERRRRRGAPEALDTPAESPPKFG